MLQLFHIAAFRNAYLRRGLVIWGGLRFALSVGSIPDPTFLLEVLLLLAVAAAVGLDARRRGEDLFLGNLGVPTFVIFVYALPLALIAESLLP